MEIVLDIQTIWQLLILKEPRFLFLLNLNWSFARHLFRKNVVASLQAARREEMVENLCWNTWLKRDRVSDI